MAVRTKSLLTLKGHAMTLRARLKAAFGWLEAFAEAMEYDPVEDLRRRVAALEQEAAAGSVANREPADDEAR